MNGDKFEGKSETSNFIQLIYTFYIIHILTDECICEIE